MTITKELPAEEKLNYYSHAFGAIAAAIGYLFLLKKDPYKTTLSFISITVYSITLISMFLVSALYHKEKNLKVKSRLRILDHINIYFLIAGTYSPVLLLKLVHGNGWLLLYVIWAIVFLGTLLKLYLTGKFEVISLILYLVMGWLIVVDFDNLAAQITQRGLVLLVAGGMSYTIGILFYIAKKIPYHHFIWHLFVLVGALLHWLFIYSEVL